MLANLISKYNAAKLKLADFKLIISILFLLTYLTYYRVSIIAYRYSSFYCLI